MNQPDTSPSSRSPAPSTSEAEFAEDQFFDGLVAGDVERVEQLLSQDFVIVDLMTGAVADRAAFVGALRDGRLQFERMELMERLTRHHGDTAIIVGRTEMSGSFDAASFAAASRYTHVLVRERDGRWRLASAQGTRIVDA